MHRPAPPPSLGTRAVAFAVAVAAAWSFFGLLAPSPGLARDAAPAASELVAFEESWDLRRARAGEPVPPSEAQARLALGGWEVGKAPFEGRTSGRRKGSSATLLDLSGFEALGDNAAARSDEELDQESVYWFVREVEVEAAASIESLLVESRFVGGFVLFVNGQEVLRHRLDMDNRYQPFGEIPELPEFVREGRSSTAQRAFRGIDPSALVDGTNTIAVRVHRRPGHNARPIYFDLRLAAFHDKGFVKGPYLQRMGPDTVTIMFESSVISTPYIEYGAGSELTESATSPSTGGTLHEVTLTGLQPDTRYFYRVRAEKIWPPLEGDEDSSLLSSVYYFHTAPDEPRGFTFLAYGDNRSQPHIHTAIVERMLAEKGAFVLNTGDLTNTGVDYRQWQNEFFEPARPLMHYLPMWPSLGNHEGNHISYFEYFSLPGNEAWYSFRYGNAEFFALNTAYNVRAGSTQYAWFKDAIAASTARWKVVFFHHPPFSCTPARLPGFGPVRDHMVPLFEEHGVDLVLTGHDHLYAHGELNGVHYVITGGGGAWTYPAQVEPPNTFCEQVYHYSVIRVEDDALFLRATDKDGGEVDAFAIRR